MEAPLSPSRRDVIKTLGLGAACLAVGAVHPALAAEEAPPQPFVLPALGYGYAALEPAVDARTMELHHGKHHQAYVDAANRALAQHPAWKKKTAEQLLASIHEAPEPLRAVIRNQVGGHANHTHFWRILAPGGRRRPGTELGLAIDQAFGSLDSLKLRFVDAAMKRFGSGWAWLALNPSGKLEVFSTANQDSPLMHHYTPVIGLDVWEHAYYLNYQHRRLDYVEAAWSLINWSEADALFSKTATSNPTS